MAIPTQVQQAAEEADRLMTPPAPPALEPQPPADPKPAESVTPVEPSKPEPPQEDFAQKYRTLQGMFNATTKRLDTAMQQVADLQAEVARLTARSETPKPEPKQKLVTAKDAEDFGSDLLDAIRRQALDAVGEELAALRAKVDGLESENSKLRDQVGTVKQHASVASQKTFFAELDRLAPDWRTINVDQRWLDWLAAQDPLTGVERQRSLDDAIDREDAARVASILGVWKREVGFDQPKPPAPKPLAMEVQPTTAAATPQVPSADATRIWTAAEVDQFYRAVGRGDYRGRPQEQERLMKEIDLALSQGRVR